MILRLIFVELLNNDKLDKIKGFPKCNNKRLIIGVSLSLKQ